MANKKRSKRKNRLTRSVTTNTVLFSAVPLDDDSERLDDIDPDKIRMLVDQVIKRQTEEVIRSVLGGSPRIEKVVDGERLEDPMLPFKPC